MKKLLLVLLLLCSPFASASVYWYGVDHGTTHYATAQSACESYYGDPSTWPAGIIIKAVFTSDTTATCNSGYSAGSLSQYASTSSTGTCDAGTTWSGTAHACVSVCTAGSVQTIYISEGTYSSFAEANQSNGLPLPTNVSGCGGQVVGVHSCGYHESNGQAWCQVDFQQSGAWLGTGAGSTTPISSPGTSTPTDPHLSAGTGQSCPSGTTNIGTDSTGGAICAGGASSSPSNPPSTSTVTNPTVTNPDGSTDQTTTHTVHNSDGSDTTTTETTHCANGTCTTTSTSTTSNNSNGQPGQDDQNQKNDLCKTHPDLNICNNSSVSGACAGGVDTTSCSGDAIQCAILRTEANRICQQRADEAAITSDSMYTLGNQVASGNDPMASQLPTKDNATNIDLSSNAIDTSGFLGAGSCYPDKQFTLEGHTFTIPFATACSYLIVFRFVIMTIAALLSFRMLSGTFLRD